MDMVPKTSDIFKTLMDIINIVDILDIVDIVSPAAASFVFFKGL
jgi:hypothetical protein